MLTFVTLAEPMVPDPLPTLHVSPAGGVCTATEYAAPPASGVANTKFSLVALLVFVNVSASPPLSRSVMEVPLGNPVIVPPTVKVDAATGVTTMVTGIQAAECARDLIRRNGC
jgi:hypothetical protein